jgi:hypothetical protein
MTKLNFYNYKSLSKELTVDCGLTRSELDLFESVLFWALQNNDVNKTVNVEGKRRTTLINLRNKTRLIQTYMSGEYLGAKLLGEYELDTTWFGN